MRRERPRRCATAELIDEIAHVTVDELEALIERGEVMLPSVQTAVMALAHLRRVGLL